MFMKALGKPALERKRKARSSHVSGIKISKTFYKKSTGCRCDIVVVRGLHVRIRTVCHHRCRKGTGRVMMMLLEVLHHEVR